MKTENLTNDAPSLITIDPESGDVTTLAPLPDCMEWVETEADDAATDEEDEIDDDDREIRDAYRELTNDDATLEEARDKFAGYIDGDRADFVREFVDECGGLEILPREILERYFDWEGYARDCFLDSFDTADERHVFWTN